MKDSKHSLITEAIFCVALAISGGCSKTEVAEDPSVPDDGNSAPSISGFPAASIIVGENYSFTPSASDPDGDNLTFAITSQPAWSNFSTEIGQLSGSPGPSDIGQYSNIIVSVSDGDMSTSLPGFSIDVVDVGNFSVSLSWTPPTQNSDNSPLADLAAYKIYYGIAEGEYPNAIQINNPGISTYVVEGLAANTYYFVATAINSNGTESDFSNVAIYVLN